MSPQVHAGWAHRPHLRRDAGRGGKRVAGVGTQARWHTSAPKKPQGWPCKLESFARERLLAMLPFSAWASSNKQFSPSRLPSWRSPLPNTLCGFLNRTAGQIRKCLRWDVEVTADGSRLVSATFTPALISCTCYFPALDEVFSVYWCSPSRTSSPRWLWCTVARVVTIPVSP